MILFDTGASLHPMCNIRKCASKHVSSPSLSSSFPITGSISFKGQRGTCCSRGHFRESVSVDSDLRPPPTGQKLLSSAEQIKQMGRTAHLPRPSDHVNKTKVQNRDQDQTGRNNYSSILGQRRVLIR